MYKMYPESRASEVFWVQRNRPRGAIATPVKAYKRWNIGIPALGFALLTTARRSLSLPSSFAIRRCSTYKSAGNGRSFITSVIFTEWL